MVKSNSTPYVVGVGTADAKIFLYDAQTIDEACAIALGYFRNSNSDGITFFISRDEEVIVRFDR